MSKYFLTDTAVKMFCPGNVMQLDDAGLPSILVYIPKFKNSDVLSGGDDNTHPAFIVNDKEVDGFYYSKYQNVVHNGKAYSLPGEDPHVNAKYDKAVEYCTGKGYGWHMSTAAEWAAIALWCRANDFMPYGNNNYGKDSRETEYKAIETSKNNDGTTMRVATGTGPMTWSHNNTVSGIWDMNGNVWERQGGIRLVWGELQILANNNAADPDNPQNATSTCWKAISAADGSLVEPESKTTDTAVKTTGNTVKFDYINSAWTYSTGISSAGNASRSCQFTKMACTDAISDTAKTVLRALALLPDNGVAVEEYADDSVWLNNAVPERVIARGGSSSYSTGSGVFSILGHLHRDEVYQSLGFRAAYIPDII